MGSYSGICGPVLGGLMHLLKPPVVRMIRAKINRETVANVQLAGFVEVRANDLWLNFLKRTGARAPTSPTPTCPESN